MFLNWRLACYWVKLSNWVALVLAKSGVNSKVLYRKEVIQSHIALHKSTQFIVIENQDYCFEDIVPQNSLKKHMYSCICINLKLFFIHTYFLYTSVFKQMFAEYVNLPIWNWVFCYMHTSKVIASYHLYTYTRNVNIL